MLYLYRVYWGLFSTDHRNAKQLNTSNYHLNESNNNIKLRKHEKKTYIPTGSHYAAELHDHDKVGQRTNKKPNHHIFSRCLSRPRWACRRRRYCNGHP